MSHNKSRILQQAVRNLEMLMILNVEDPHALPGSALKHVREARKILLRDIRKRRDARDREETKQEKPRFPGYSTLPFK